MGIGKMTTTPDGIHRYYNMFDKQVFVGGGGLGCETICYKSVADARAIVNTLGRIPTGRDAKLCGVCNCHFQEKQKGYKAYPPCACVGYKNGIADLAVVIREKNPKVGKMPIGQTSQERAIVTRAIRKEMKSKQEQK